MDVELSSKINNLPVYFNFGEKLRIKASRRFGSVGGRTSLIKANSASS